MPKPSFRRTAVRPTPARPWLAEAAVFLAVAFPAAGALGALQPATGLPTDVLQLTQFGPTLGVAAVALGRPARIRHRLAGALPGPGQGSAAPALLFSGPLLVALAALAHLLLRGHLPFTDPATLPAPFAVVAAAQLLGACGEELGWRCFLQPLLRTRFGPLASSITVGLLWGCWHVQVFARSAPYAAGFLIATVAMSVVLGLAQERLPANRLLLSGGFHALVNLGMLLVLDEETGDTLPMLLFALAATATALPWALRPRAARPALT
ncbi:CPBP family intramembrane glutamic endopeptidase [Kitasatospora sp. NPDC049285]|uniref:CPBP family intramembrane glutamic endopeptidase n=1 Tax=Kitasatospora sp. NPDC049285 TaxID=3157096 RepID=UPI003436875C